MRTTSCKVDLKLTDVSARADSTIISTSTSSYSNNDILKGAEAVELPPYATLYLNQFVLDGSKSFVDKSERKIAYMSSTSTSSSTCLFTTNPKVTITFDDVHTSAGLTLTFGLIIPREIIVTWYSKGGNKIATTTEYPDRLVYVINQQVQNYSRIEIEFVKTHLPKQRASLQSIDYGLFFSWSGEKIKSAKVYEEVDTTGSSLSINTASVSILDEEREFDVSDNNALWKSIQKTQEVKITEIIDGEEVNIGKYFVSGSSYTGNVASFNMVDTIGLLDSFTYYNGEVYNGRRAVTIINDIMSTAGITDYEVAGELNNCYLNGWLGIMTCREALQNVCFACGCIADDSRGKLQIKYPDKRVKYVIDTARKFKTNVGLIDYVSGVSIAFKTYTKGTEEQEIFSGKISEGLTEIVFSAPYDVDTIHISTTNSVNVITLTTNHIILQSNSEQNCTITGTPYNVDEVSYLLNSKNAEGGETTRVINYAGCTLYNLDKVKEIAKDLLYYHQMRKKIEARYILNNERVGEWVTLNTKDGYNIIGLVESQNIDLTGGFIATVKGVGYTQIVIEEIYTGNEMYAGSGGLL